MKDTGPRQPRLHPLSAAGLLVWIAGAGLALFLGDWKWIAYGFLAFLTLGIVGALLQERGTR
ncbi:hypothetical protein GCM10009613_60970 [Pseudonocardia kongjuensis]|uniref:Uncharacterized protein n=1 Tax=Pseudonocardia kongjuensis TaxID=102227 RepID=A0ABN1YBS2_9PSEU